LKLHPAVGLFLAVQLALYFYARTRHELFFAAQARLDDAAKTTVKEVQQVLAEDFKKALVDHRLKGDTAAELRATAIKIMLTNLGPLGLHELRRVLGLSRKAAIDRFLVGRVEAALYDLKGRSINNGEVPSAPGGRFYPDTLRIPRIEKPDEHMFDEKTKITGR
jgi:hypothetical protein